MQMLENVNLIGLNTFHFEVVAKKLLIVKSCQELIEWLHTNSKEQKNLSILGGGSNILFTKNIENWLLKNEIKGREIISENEDEIHVKFMSGENWHECVIWAVENNLGGIENLSLIPGTIGAAPIQNIGAYGVELKDTFISCEALELKTQKIICIDKEACKFDYRNSYFKQDGKNKYFIVSVTLCLQKKPKLKTDYGAIKNIIESDFDGVFSVKNVSQAVIKIRTEKLPDPAKIGNAGSFFKNPIIPTVHFESLKNQFADIPYYKTSIGYKIPAAWLIEQCGWKGYQTHHVGVHPHQALVLIHLGEGQGKEIIALSKNIITSVQQRFNITLEPEVNIW